MVVNSTGSLSAFTLGKQHNLGLKGDIELLSTFMLLFEFNFPTS